MEPASTSDVLGINDRISESGTGSRIVDTFSLLQGGAIYRFQAMVGMAMPDKSGTMKRAFVLALLTWFPLFLLSVVQGRAFGSHVQMPFLYDFAASSRFLIGVPLLVIAEAVIDPRINRAVRHFVKSGLVAHEDVPAFEQVIRRTNTLRDSIIPAVLILAAAFVPSIWYRETELLKNGVSTWHTIVSPAGEHLSAAAWWLGFIALPVFRILLFRWVWMILLWAGFLRRVANIDLRCIATHPDNCGGLGFLTKAQVLFGFIAFAASAVLAGAFANTVTYQGATVYGLKFLIIASCLFSVVLIAAPLLVLTPKLERVQREAIYDYGSLGASYTQAFETKWIQGTSTEREPLLGTADIQSLADLGGSFSVVQEMKIVLIGKRLLIELAIASSLPMVPLVLIATPADQLVRAVLKILV